MVNITRILHPTDFSDNSRPALAYASDFARQFHAELHILSVVDSRLFTGIPADPGFFPPEYMEEYLKVVEKQMADLTFEGISELKKIIRVVRSGLAIIEIINYARDAKIDLIVMGTHGRTGLKHVLIGSVAENVVRKAGCPVLTVRSVE